MKFGISVDCRLRMNFFKGLKLEEEGRGGHRVKKKNELISKAVSMRNKERLTIKLGTTKSILTLTRKTFQSFKILFIYLTPD